MDGSNENRINREECVEEKIRNKIRGHERSRIDRRVQVNDKIRREECAEEIGLFHHPVKKMEQGREGGLSEITRDVANKGTH